MVIKMAKEAFDALIAELSDKTKVTHMYLDKFGNPFDPDLPHTRLALRGSMSLRIIRS